MKLLPWLSRRQKSLMECAPIGPEKDGDRAMRTALRRAKAFPQSVEKYACQQAFDGAASALVGALPIPREVEHWFANEKLVGQKKRSWVLTARDPAILAVGIAVAVMFGVFLVSFVEHMNDFPGSQTAQKLLVTASASRGAKFEPIETDAGEIGDWVFMKFQLEHYDVPPQFADFKTAGCRIFDDQDGHRVAQIQVVEKRMQFFLFPCDQSTKDDGSDKWNFVAQDGWVGAVQRNEGVCFMAVLHGEKEELAPYLAKPVE